MQSDRSQVLVQQPTPGMSFQEPTPFFNNYLPPLLLLSSLEKQLLALLLLFVLLNGTSLLEKLVSLALEGQDAQAALLVAELVELCLLGVLLDEVTAKRFRFRLFPLAPFVETLEALLGGSHSFGAGLQAARQLFLLGPPPGSGRLFLVEQVAQLPEALVAVPLLSQGCL